MIIEGLTEEKYNLLPGVRSSHLSRLLKSPRHYKHSLTAPGPKTEALEFGTKFHMAVLEKERFLKTYKVIPDFGNQTYKANKEAKAAWLSDQPKDQSFITEKESDQIKGMVESLILKDSFNKLIACEDLKTELTLTEKYRGRDVKIRADAISIKHKRIIDLKTTVSARPESFRFSVKDYSYDVQAAYYLLVASLATNTDIKEWSHYTVAVEKEAPYENQTFSYTEEAIGTGLRKTNIAFDLLEECEKSNNWYGYPDIILPLGAFASEFE